jgi:hypothetical protein
MADCAHCGEPIPERITDELRHQARRVAMILPAPGRSRRFCTDRCRKRAFRRRRAGIPEHAYPRGAARGHVALGALTRGELDGYWTRQRLLADLRQIKAEPERHT